MSANRATYTIPHPITAFRTIFDIALRQLREERRVDVSLPASVTLAEQVVNFTGPLEFLLFEEEDDKT